MLKYPRVLCSTPENHLFSVSVACPVGALKTCTYGEVSPIFLGHSINLKVIFLCPNKTKIMAMLFVGISFRKPTSIFIVSGYFMFVYGCQSIK